MEGFAQNAVPSYSDVPYNKRWELLKPFMEQLYIQEKRKLREIVDIMKSRHKFYASEAQYKRQFGLWKLKKNIPTPKKTTICETIHSRAQMGKSSVVKYRGQDVEPRKLRRYLKTKARQNINAEVFLGVGHEDIEALSGHALQCGNKVFMNWNMPHIILRIPRAKAYDHVSPFGPATSTPSDILVATPSSANVGPSPRNATPPRDALSPKNAPSPVTVAVRDNIKMDRAHLFVQGRHMELLEGMNRQERKVMTNWMHQFWLFSYKTAKTWGHGPRRWTPSMLGFDDYSERRIINLPNSPSLNIGSPAYHTAQQHVACEDEDARLPKPTPLCQWSIHIRCIDYERIPSPPLVVPEEVDPNDEKSWTAWPDPQSITQFSDALQANLENNDFSNIQVKDLPISATQIARAVRRSPKELLEEAFGFSIMGRNLELILDLLEEVEMEHFAISGLYPLHLATSYLDGSKTCCNVFNAIVEGMPAGEASVRKLYTNHLNHTVLDNLMIAILKAHTSCLPSVVDDAFKKEMRFAGEEVDICGRWDADSKCIRTLLANGNPTIPFEWKHMFCHTSIQAICHCIGNLFGPHWSPDINTPSGLFTKRCSNETCGLKLQLMPLHTLVLTAVHLGSQGSKGETLFGMLACLLCLLGNGANPLLKASISLNSLLSDDDDHECSHTELDPLELAQKVPDNLTSRWPHDVKVGWQVFCHVLSLSQVEWRSKRPRRRDSSTTDEFRDEFSEFIEDSDSSEDAMSIGEADNNDETADPPLPAECQSWDRHKCFFGRNEDLSTIWAAVQTEFVTYRRLQEGDPWISPNFNMESLLESLKSGHELSIGLVEKKMMKSYCDCGKFDGAEDEVCVRGEEVSAQYFSNLEDWNRSTFIETPSYRMEFWYCQ